MENVVWRKLATLKPYPGNPRRHPEAQIASLMKSIRRVWTNPILIDESGTILAGHGRLEAAKRLGMIEVPTVTIGGLSSAEKRAILIADNRIPERAISLLKAGGSNVLSRKVDFPSFKGAIRERGSS